MINVSNEFKKAVYAPSRMVNAKVRFEILDITAFKDNTKTVTSEALISRSAQLTNKVRKMDNKYAVLEKDYLKLDGSFILPPHIDEMVDTEMGWWSEALCDNNCMFTPYQALEFDFNQVHSSMGLTIYFDILNNEYASDFDIDVYDINNNSIAHETITGNSASTYVNINQFANYKKIIVTVKKWCKPYRRAKVVEVDFGIIKEYEDDTLINMNLVQEVDTTSSTLPPDELKFTVDNLEKSFNILNPQGFYQFLQQGQESFAEIGVVLPNNDVEFVQIGKFYLKEQQSDEGALTTTFTARDLLDSFSDNETEGTAVRNITLYDLAVEVMTASGIEDYILSDNLKNINTNGLFNKISYRNLLQLIAVAGMCVVYTDNTGKLHMQQIISAKDVLNSVSVTSEANISNKNQIIDNILEPSFKIATFEKNRFALDGSFVVPVEDMSKFQVGWLSGELSFADGTFANQQEITLTTSEEHSSTNLSILFDTLNGEYASNFEIQGFDVNNNLVLDENIINNTQTQYLYQNNLLASTRKIVIIIKSWCKPYSRAKVSEISFDLPVDSITFDNAYNKPQIKLNQAVKAVEVTYYPNGNLNDKAVYTETNNNVNSGATLTVDNSLVNTLADAQNLAQWILKWNNQVADFQIDWRQNPALMLTDKVSLENGYGGNSIVNIIKQEINYQGYLSGKTEARGVI